MSRTGAKKRTLNNSTSGSGTGKKKSITPTKLAERSNSTKSIPQKQVQALKRRIINRKGRDEDVRQNIDAKWRDGNQMMSQSRSENNPIKKKSTTRPDLALTIANFDNLMQK